MLQPEPVIAIPLMALAVLLVSGTAVLCVRLRAKKKSKPSKTERELFRDFGSHTSGEDELAEPTESGFAPQEPHSGSSEDVRRMRGMVKNTRKKSVSVHAMSNAVRRKAGR